MAIRRRAMPPPSAARVRAEVLSSHVAALPRPAAGGLLAGLRVVELATMVAAPAAAAMLCDHGAEVVKIENPRSPDYTRVWGRGDDPARTADPALRGAPGGGGSNFTQFNRGKRGVALDPTKPEGLALLLKLLGDADIFITNVRPRALARMGLDYETLSPRLPRLIYGHLTAYGRAGPMQDEPGYDFAAFWAYSGAMDGVRSADDGAMPRSIGSFGDNITASQLFGGVLGALYHRQRTGEGQLVDASLLRAGVCAMSDPIVRRLSGSSVSALYCHRGSNPITYAVFRCADGVWLQLLGIEVSRHLPGLLRATGLRAETLFGGKDTPGKDTDWAAATRVVDAAMATRPAAEWEAAFREHGVWHVRVGSVRDMPGGGAWEQARAIGAFVDAPGVRHPLLGTPVLLSAAPAAPRRGAPRHGEHTDDVLRAAGCSDADLRRLRDGGVIL